jgi:hypothetical protein
MKFNDDITMSIASTVKDVLEGKAPVKKEEVQYPHDMYHPETGEKEVANNEAEHKALSDKGYTHEKNEVAEPEPKGEKEFKAKHVIKKSGENNDGTVTKEATDLDEDVDQTFGFPSKDKLVKFQSQVKGVKPLGNPNIMKRGGKEYHVMMFKGSVKNIEKAMKLAMSIYDESVSFNEEVDEQSEKQKKYQAFFNKALKKFGVDSPAELEGDKKKEFFDYIDANYEADNEEVEESIEVEEATITVTNFTGKAPAGIKMKKIGSGRYGGDDVTMTGDDKKLIAYAVRSLGVDKNKVKDIKSLQKEIDANG